ncbi:unnamed protein product [Gongylonema pulchrum]|uniref:PLAT domain-containing protein n=1 Tax=Gongylonema pulchrum TaxID=637853 RepID=A0A183DLC5_9BILA|nr:unnamed protein product [Gongylonema pulchrum]
MSLVRLSEQKHENAFSGGAAGAGYRVTLKLGSSGPVGEALKTLFFVPSAQSTTGTRAKPAKRTLEEVLVGDEDMPYRR